MRAFRYCSLFLSTGIAIDFSISKTLFIVLVTTNIIFTVRTFTKLLFHQRQTPLQLFILSLYPSSSSPTNFCFFIEVGRAWGMRLVVIYRRRAGVVHIACVLSTAKQDEKNWESTKQSQTNDDEGCYTSEWFVYGKEKPIRIITIDPMIYYCTVFLPKHHSQHSLMCVCSSLSYRVLDQTDFQRTNEQQDKNIVHTYLRFLCPLGKTILQQRSRRHG